LKVLKIRKISTPALFIIISGNGAVIYASHVRKGKKVEGIRYKVEGRR